MTRTPSKAVRLGLAVLLPLALAGCWGAMRSSPDDPKSAGGLTPTVEDKDLGLVGLAPGFQVNRYPVIAVAPFPVVDPGVNDEGDRRLAAEMTAFLQSELVRRLRESGLFRRVVNLAETPGYRPGSGESALRLEGEITRLGRGSQAARYFAGVFGAGRTRAQADMKFVDAGTGKVMMVAADRRIAQVGMFGGADRDHLRESFDDMARDVARFLVRLSQGQAPAK